MDTDEKRRLCTHAWLMALGLGALLLPGCLRAAEERAERDREVGHARGQRTLAPAIVENRFLGFDRIDRTRLGHRPAPSRTVPGRNTATAGDR